MVCTRFALLLPLGGVRDHMADDDMYDEPGGTTMKDPSMVDCLRRFCARVPREATEFPNSRAASISLSSRSNSNISSTGLLFALLFLDEFDDNNSLFSSSCREDPHSFLDSSATRDDDDGPLPLVAVPKNMESEISASLFVTNAPRTVARRRSFCVRALLIIAFVPSCFFKNSFNARADLAWDCDSRSNEFESATSFGRASRAAARNPLAAKE
mmetsp:Transcript_16043/g.26806  ORF Transcript_16043/g.26806 Transcript_16043/m.26806 type:complete len:213 (-) Transcript_16043:484-1122(-)